LTAGAGKREKSEGRFNVLPNHWLQPFVSPLKQLAREFHLPPHWYFAWLITAWRKDNEYAAETKTA